MAPRYDFQSVGGNVVSLIDQLRERDKVEKRQAMLDEIARQNSESNRAVQSAGIKRTEQDTINAQTERELKMVNEAEPGLEVGDDPPTEVAPLFQKYGKTKPSKFEEGSGETVPFQAPQIGEEGGLEGPMEGLGQAVKPKFTKGGYLGTQAQRDEQDNIRRAGELEKVLSDPNRSQADKTAAIFKTTVESEKGRMPAGGYAALLQSMQPEPQEATLLPDNTYNMGGKIVTNVPPGTKITRGFQPHQESRAPMGPQPTFIGTDPDGKAVHSSWGQTFTSGPDGKRVPFSGSLSGKPAPEAPPTPTPSSQIQQFNVLMGKRESGRPEDIAAAAQAIEGLISVGRQRKMISDDVANLIRDVLNTESDATPTAAIIKSLAGQFDTPQEEAQFADFLNTVRGR